jgi:hypothetical protein
MLEQLREVAGMGGPAASLANELLVLNEQYTTGNLSKEEYQYLVQQIGEIRASQELASDEQACRFIVQSAQLLYNFV